MEKRNIKVTNLFIDLDNFRVSIQPLFWRFEQ